MRIMSSTNRSSTLPAIEEAYGKKVADAVREAIRRLFVEEVTKTWDSKEVTKAKQFEEICSLRILGQPVGSTTFAEEFFQKRLEENKRDVAKLLKTVPNHHMALRLFAQCTLHKLPHLLGVEVMYSPMVTDANPQLARPAHGRH